MLALKSTTPTHCPQHLNDKHHEGTVNEAAQQVAFADVLLINKVDLVSSSDKENVIDAVRAINGAAKLIECQLNDPAKRPPAASLLDVELFSVNKALQVDPTLLDSESDDETITARPPADLAGPADRGSLDLPHKAAHRGDHCAAGPACSSPACEAAAGSKPGLPSSSAAAAADAEHIAPGAAAAATLYIQPNAFRFCVASARLSRSLAFARSIPRLPCPSPSEARLPAAPAEPLPSQAKLSAKLAAKVAEAAAAEAPTDEEADDYHEQVGALPANLLLRSEARQPSLACPCTSRPPSLSALGVERVAAPAVAHRADPLPAARLQVLADTRPAKKRKAHHDLSGISSIGVTAVGPLDEYRFNMYMRDLLTEKAKDIFRCKVRAGRAPLLAAVAPAALLPLFHDAALALPRYVRLTATSVVAAV